MKALIVFVILVVVAGFAFAGRTSATQGSGLFGSSRTVEQWPGHVRLHQSRGGSSATITQNGSGTMRIDQD